MVFGSVFKKQFTLSYNSPLIQWVRSALLDVFLAVLALQFSVAFLGVFFRFLFEFFRLFERLFVAARSAGHRTRAGLAAPLLFHGGHAEGIGLGWCAALLECFERVHALQPVFGGTGLRERHGDGSLRHPVVHAVVVLADRLRVLGEVVVHVGQGRRTQHVQGAGLEAEVLKVQATALRGLRVQVGEVEFLLGTEISLKFSAVRVRDLHGDELVVQVLQLLVRACLRDLGPQEFNLLDERVVLVLGLHVELFDVRELLAHLLALLLDLLRLVAWIRHDLLLLLHLVPQRLEFGGQFGQLFFLACKVHVSVGSLHWRHVLTFALLHNVVQNELKLVLLILQQLVLLHAVVVAIGHALFEHFL